MPRSGNYFHSDLVDMVLGIDRGHKSPPLRTWFLVQAVSRGQISDPMTIGIRTSNPGMFRYERAIGNRYRWGKSTCRELDYEPTWIPTPLLPTVWRTIDTLAAKEWDDDTDAWVERMFATWQNATGRTRYKRP